LLHLGNVLQEGRSLGRAALGHLEAESSQGSRLALLHNPGGDVTADIGAGGDVTADVSAGGDITADVSMLACALTAASRLQSRRPKIVAFLENLLDSHAGDRCSLSLIEHAIISRHEIIEIS